MSDTATVIGSIPKAKGEVLRIVLNEYKGAHFLDVRTYFLSHSEPPECLPTKKGVTLRLAQLDEMIAILQRARIEAQRLGLLESL